MKIYPSNHIITAKEKTTPRDIPLAYLENIETNESLRIDFEPKFVRPETVTPVNIYQKFIDPDTFFFDSNRKRVDIELKRVGAEYIYSPEVTEFTPESFTWKAVLKRNGQYSATVPYNIRIGVVENSILSSDFSNDLISIFSDAAKRNLCPENIRVNNNSEDPNFLINKSYKDCDILFVGSSTGTGSIKALNETIHVSDLLDINCNVWLAVDSFAPMLQSMPPIKNEAGDPIEQSISCALSSSMLYNQESYRISGYPYYFDMERIHPAYPPSAFEYINLFVGTCPILLLKRNNGGFIIVSEKSFLGDIRGNVKLIYEILMYVYLHSYCHTNERTSWITDNPVNYYLNLNNKYDRSHPTISLTDALRKDNVSLKQPLTISDIVTSDNVVYTGTDERAQLYFAKKNASDPISSDDTRTILSANDTVLLCSSVPVITTIEEELTVTYEKDGAGYLLTIDPYISSELKVNTDRQEIRIPGDVTEYVLYVKQLTNADSVFIVTPKAIYDNSGIYVADIRIIRKSVTNVFDLRQLGGGEASKNVNYEMIDESNLLGRPYRRGGVIVVTLPKRYEKYETLIRQELDKNINSGSLPILIFEGT